MIVYTAVLRHRSFDVLCIFYFGDSEVLLMALAQLDALKFAMSLCS